MNIKTLLGMEYISTRYQDITISENSDQVVNEGHDWVGISDSALSLDELYRFQNRNLSIQRTIYDPL